MGYEEDRRKLRWFMNVFLLAARTGKLNVLFGILLECFKLKLSWDIAMTRLDGSFYQKQVGKAVQDYKDKHSKEFETDTSGVADGGYDRWKRTFFK